MTTDKDSDPSDAELRIAVNDGWHRLERSVKVKSRTKARKHEVVVATLAARTKMSSRQLDMARRVRNQSAHPDEPVPREQLLAASQIIAEAEERLRSRRRPEPGGVDRQVNPHRATSYRRLGLRPPASRPAAVRKEGSGPTQTGEQRTAEPRYVEFHVTVGEGSTPRLISLADLGFSTRAATVTCDVPWLRAAIIGDSVELVAAPFGTAGKRHGSARVFGQRRSVTMVVHVLVSGDPPRQTIPATPPNHREAVWTVTRAVFVALVLGVLLLLAIGLASGAGAVR